MFPFSSQRPTENGGDEGQGGGFLRYSSTPTPTVQNSSIDLTMGSKNKTTISGFHLGHGTVGSSLTRHNSSSQGLTNPRPPMTTSVHNHIDASSAGMRPWDDSTHSIMFSVAPPSNKAKATSSSGVILNNHTNGEIQLQFNLSQSEVETMSMDRLVNNVPNDSIRCKIRAKRGCATHPRSIAERERRTRISGKLKKLQDLVPNMDKQTSYADMLDLAVQHIKGLQNKVEKLNGELESCTCGCRLSG